MVDDGSGLLWISVFDVEADIDVYLYIWWLYIYIYIHIHIDTVTWTTKMKKTPTLLIAIMVAARRNWRLLMCFSISLINIEEDGTQPATPWEDSAPNPEMQDEQSMSYQWPFWPIWRILRHLLQSQCQGVKAKGSAWNLQGAWAHSQRDEAIDGQKRNLGSHQNSSKLLCGLPPQSVLWICSHLFNSLQQFNI